MNKDIKIPDWIGKSNVPEDRETTIELLEVYASLIETSCPYIGKTLNDEDFLEMACTTTNTLNTLFGDFPLPELGIWTGFPTTPIGKLNAALAHRVWLVKRALEEK